MSASVPISGLTALSAALSASDLFVFVDVSDPSQAATGTTKNITVANAFTSVTVTTSLTVTGTASISSTLSVTGATTLTGALTTLSSVSITGTANVSPVFNTTTGATSDFIQLLFARGGANKWRLGTNIDGTNVDAFQIRNEALGAVVLSLANATGAATFSSTIASGAITSSGNIESTAGNIIVAAAASLTFGVSARSIINSASDGVLKLSNAAQSDFSRLQFGGTTSSFPAIKRNAAALNFRLADDSADAAITSGAITSGAINGQTISSAASFTGTVTTAGVLTVNANSQLGATGGTNTVTIGGAGYGAGVASLRLNGLTNGAAVNTGTLNTCPRSGGGDPQFWLPINIAGTVHYVPAWTT